MVVPATSTTMQHHKSEAVAAQPPAGNNLLQHVKHTVRHQHWWFTTILPSRPHLAAPLEELNGNHFACQHVVHEQRHPKLPTP